MSAKQQHDELSISVPVILQNAPTTQRKSMRVLISKQVTHWPITLELQDRLGIFLSWVILGTVHQVPHSHSLKGQRKDILVRIWTQKS